VRDRKDRSSSPSVHLLPSSKPGGGGTPSSSPPPEPPRIDLTRFTEATRRAIWDALAATCFGATAAQVRAAEAEGDWVEVHTAEEAGLVVFSAWGRWLAAWRVLDEPADAPDDMPEKFRYDVVSLHEDPGQPYGLGLSEV
jgi:hypothetical protein